MKAALGAGPSAAQRTRQRARFVAEAGAGRRRFMRELGIGLVAAGLGSIVMYGVFALRTPDGLAAPEHVGDTFVFNEASRVTLAPGATARIERASGHEAVVVLESGSVSCSITSGLKNLWRFRAGPNEAIVRGTKFVLSWDPRTEEFGLNVTEGRVEVHRPGRDPQFAVPGKPVAWVKPQPIEMPALELESEPEKVMQLDELALDEQPSAKRAQKKKSVVQRGAEMAPEFIESEPEKRGLVPEWKRHAEAGRYAKAVGLVEEQGVQVALLGVSSDDLLLFADSARLARNAPLSRAALTLLRERFKGTPDAAEGAFRLGRLEFDAHHNVEAGDWFDAYVKEAPAGAFIAEAMGRRLDAWQRAPDPRVARAATDYLEKYPKGAYAPIARQVLAGP